ncbi:MAG: helix-turn-helix domain-containing protein [Betaproteobacteria bacterium]|nr:helix-turn-helix domain-containing protein [Betaproteobacteria bacterium]
MFHYTDGGLKSVWLANGFEFRDSPYGKTVAFHNVDGLTVAICDALANKPSGLTSAEFRYLRLALGLSQASLARVMGNTENTIANWERGRKLPAMGDKLVRVLYQAHRNGKRAVKNVVASLNFSDRLKNQKLVLEARRGRWRAARELQAA